jgi:hypothetical protein
MLNIVGLLRIELNIGQRKERKKKMAIEKTNGMFFGLVVGIFLFLLLVLFLSTYYHELVHKRVFASYGCDSKIEFNWQGGVTIPNEANSNCNVCLITGGDCTRDQSMVENEGYHSINVVMTIIFSLIFYIFYDFIFRE